MVIQHSVHHRLLVFGVVPVPDIVFRLEVDCTWFAIRLRGVVNEILLTRVHVVVRGDIDGGGSLVGKDFYGEEKVFLFRRYCSISRGPRCRSNWCCGDTRFRGG